MLFGKVNQKSIFDGFFDLIDLCFRIKNFLSAYLIEHSLCNLRLIFSENRNGYSYRKSQTGFIRIYKWSILCLNKANIEIYLSNPAGIGEHSDVLEAINIELERVVTADEKIHILINNWEY